MKRDWISWISFIVLSFIWGSSYILMKIGLLALTPYQVAAIRIATSGLVLSPVALKHIRSIPKNKILIIFLTGAIGNLIPAFLFCLAEQGIDASLAGTINSITPIFAIITGVLFFSSKTSVHKIIGIIIAFFGTSLLFFGKATIHSTTNVIDAFYVILATILYGYNVNLVHAKLKDIRSLQITSVALFLNGILAFIILICTGYFHADFLSKNFLLSTGAAALLGTVGTAIATIIFYQLVKRAGAVFASMVTYGMPFVAIFWGFVAGENIGWGQILCLVLILAGVYYANRKGAGK